MSPEIVFTVPHAPSGCLGAQCRTRHMFARALACLSVSDLIGNDRFLVDHEPVDTSADANPMMAGARRRQKSDIGFSWKDAKMRVTDEGQ